MRPASQLRDARRAGRCVADQSRGSLLARNHLARAFPIARETCRAFGASRREPADERRRERSRRAIREQSIAERGARRLFCALGGIAYGSPGRVRSGNRSPARPSRPVRAQRPAKYEDGARSGKIKGKSERERGRRRDRMAGYYVRPVRASQATPGIVQSDR